MLIDPRGRVRNMVLPAGKALLPAFEAIINSFQAIDERGGGSAGHVEITIERAIDAEDIASKGTKELRGDITGFRIVDNGIGFTPANFEAFSTADTLHKLDLGGKGVGRFLWLKAFEHVEVESLYEDHDANGQLVRYERRFRFVFDDKGVIADEVRLAAAQTPLRTSVLLTGIKAPYDVKVPRKLATIALRIVQHCLSYFLRPDCPQVLVRDAADAINLNDLYHQQFAATKVEDEFVLGEHRFSLLHLRVYSAEENEHQVHFCANGREVLIENIEKFVPDIKGRIHDPSTGKPFVWATYVRSDLLDQRVDVERSSFKLARDRDEGDLFDIPITMADIKEQVAAKLRERLAFFLQPVREEKLERIRRFVYTRAPQFRPILKHRPDALDRIPPNSTDERIASELSKAHFEWETEVRAVGQKMLAGTDVDRATYDRFLEENNEIGIADLAKYVLDRRFTLDMLEKRMSALSGYALEKEIHALIFPMRTTSEDVSFDNQNLWVLDDRLTYHRLLASDQELRRIPEIASDSADRPDILIFNSPVAFAEPGAPPASVVIIEFKRPGRTDYADEDNPIGQVVRYVHRLKSGQAKDARGHFIRVAPNTPFYGYIVCDLTPKIEE